MKRGELHWAKLAPRSGSEQRGRRPVVIVSSDGFNEIPGWRSIVVVPVTTSSRQGSRGPSVVLLSKEDTGLPHDSFAICHQVTTLDRSKLEARISALPREAMQRVEDGIGAACDLRI